MSSTDLNSNTPIYKNPQKSQKKSHKWIEWYIFLHIRKKLLNLNWWIQTHKNPSLWCGIHVREIFAFYYFCSVDFSLKKNQHAWIRKFCIWNWRAWIYIRWTEQNQNTPERNWFSLKNEWIIPTDSRQNLIISHTR